jgi:undecaprenyl diphosphate synthase
MHLLKQYLIEERREIQRQGLRFKVIGKLDELDPMIQAEMQKTIDVSANNDGMTLCLAVNYGARQEITDAIRQIASAVQAGTLRPEDISEQPVNFVSAIFCCGRSATQNYG